MEGRLGSHSTTNPGQTKVSSRGQGQTARSLCIIYKLKSIVLVVLVCNGYIMV